MLTRDALLSFALATLPWLSACCSSTNGATPGGRTPVTWSSSGDRLPLTTGSIKAVANSFSIVDAGDNIFLLNTSSGDTWRLTQDDIGSYWVSISRQALRAMPAARSNVVKELVYYGSGNQLRSWNWTTGEVSDPVMLVAGTSNLASFFHPTNKHLIFVFIEQAGLGANATVHFYDATNRRPRSFDLGKRTGAIIDLEIGQLNGSTAIVWAEQGQGQVPEAVYAATIDDPTTIHPLIANLGSAAGQAKPQTSLKGIAANPDDPRIYTLVHEQNRPNAPPEKIGIFQAWESGEAVYSSNFPLNHPDIAGIDIEKAPSGGWYHSHDKSTNAHIYYRKALDAKSQTVVDGTDFTTTCLATNADGTVFAYDDGTSLVVQTLGGKYALPNAKAAAVVIITTRQ